MHMSRLQSIRLMSGGNDMSKTPLEVSISHEGVYSSPGAMAWTKATLIALNFWQLCFASPDALVAALQWVNSSHFCVFAALMFLCKCVFVQALPWSALLNPRPLPCNASKTIHLRPPREWRVFALLMDKGLLFTHGVVCKAGMGCVIMRRISGIDSQGMCHSGPATYVGDHRIELWWSLAWNRGSFANVERVCWGGRLGNPCNSPWRDSRRLRPPETDQLQPVETWRISLDLEMDSYLNVCGLWTGTPLENGEH